MSGSDGEMEEAGPANGGSDDAAMQDPRPNMSELEDLCWYWTTQSEWRCPGCVENHPPVQLGTHPPFQRRNTDMCDRCTCAWRNLWKAEQEHAVYLWKDVVRVHGNYSNVYEEAAIRWVRVHVKGVHPTFLSWAPEPTK